MRPTTRNRGKAIARLPLAFASAILAASSAFADEGLIAEGQEIFNRECSRCHQVGENAKNKVGPHLDLIIGRPAGSVESFRYSSALKKAGEDGLAWDEGSLDQYIQKPREFIKGNRMSYRGLEDAQKRAALLAWLQQISKAEPSENLAVSAPASVGQAPGFADEILKIEGDAAYGEYLAGDCVTCHQISGQVEGIPSIVGVPRDYFVRALVEYKTNVRSNEVMKNRVVNLNNEEIAALAAYFAELEPQ